MNYERRREYENGGTIRFYNVYLDGRHVGSVQRVEWDAERRIPGKRYVAARWRAKSPRWNAYTPDHRRVAEHRYTRIEAAKALARHISEPT